MTPREAASRSTVVDLFCGVGGLSYAFQAEGFRVVAGVDTDKTCQYAYEANVAGATFIPDDVTTISGARLGRLFGDSEHRVLIGCAPCQPFSLYTNRDEPDRRWRMLEEFGRLVRLTKPDVVSMENVPRVARHAVFGSFVKVLEENDYHVRSYIARAHHYGVPQRRSRLVLFASRHGEIELPAPTHVRFQTVRDAIGSLPPIAAGETHPEDELHQCRAVTEQNLKRLKATREGGSWKEWDDELRLACHNKKAGVSFRSVYGRMKWDEPSPVITTQCLGIGNGRFGHPEQDRAISLREAALLQTFPRTYKFIDPNAYRGAVHIARQIGNAVPVRLGCVIARSIASHLRDVAM